MPFSRAGQLARSVPAARPTDPLGLVAENLRVSPYGVLPVLDRNTFGEGDPSELKARVLGLIDVRDLAKVSRMVLEPVAAHAGVSLDGDSFNGSAPEAEEVVLEPRTFENIKAGEVMNTDVPHIPSVFSLHNALLTLDRYEYAALPVIDEKGQYRGLLSRADILSALGGHVRPGMVGGMATPLGVWLTNGTVNGGAPPFGLFLSGLTLAGCLAVSTLVLTAILWAMNPSWGSSALSGRIGMELDSSGMLNTMAFLAHGLLFLLCLRALPMAGIHAAEHQTVHAIERGLPLELEFVKQMPRAHDRCGTNLLGLVGLVTLGFTHVPSFSADWVLIVLVVTFFAYQSLGTWIQMWFTTRPATDKQLMSGIKAGRELMERFQAQPFVTKARPRRLLNNGLFFSALGMIIGLQAFLYVMKYLSDQLIK